MYLSLNLFFLSILILQSKNNVYSTLQSQTCHIVSPLNNSHIFEGRTLYIGAVVSDQGSDLYFQDGQSVVNGLELVVEWLNGPEKGGVNIHGLAYSFSLKYIEVIFLSFDYLTIEILFHDLIGGAGLLVS